MQGRVRGCKVYATLNTLVNDREIEGAVRCARMAAKYGADGIIIQDVGLIRALRSALPDMPLHASTQMSIHNLAGAEAAAEMGLTRVVLARELSLEQIRFITKNASVETEIFVHGALCFCHSGQCYMSALIGRRSGNRGMCAQPCRMQYSLGGRMDDYPLSLKDNCLITSLILLGLLGFVHYHGAFDTFGYAFSTFQDRRWKDLPAYRDAKQGKRIKGGWTFMPAITVGAVLLLAGLILWSTG